MARLPYKSSQDLPHEYQATPVSAERPWPSSMFNIHRMMAHSPGLHKARAMFGAVVNRDPSMQLRADYRELATIAVGQAARCAYEHHHHVERALKLGVSPKKIMAMPVWEHDPVFTDEERAIIGYAEEVISNGVRDSTFSALSAFLNAAQIVELTLLITHYNATVQFIEALQIRPFEDNGV